MRVILATGIYPPDIGGPATYVQALAGELRRKGVEVVVVTYGQKDSKTPRLQDSKEIWRAVRISRAGGPLLRWRRYAKALREACNGADLSTEALPVRQAGSAKVDAVIAFSSVSCGVPLWLARLKGPRTTRAMHSGIGAPPKTLLRLGGDFFWERYTDHGGMKGLREWYQSRFSLSRLLRFPMGWLLRTFDHIVFSTRFQEEIYEKHYRRLPSHSVIENAIPEGSPRRSRKAKTGHPLRLLYLGRIVGFKNLANLLRALRAILEPPLQRDMHLTIVGDGPMLPHLKLLTTHYSLPTTFLPPAHGAEVHRIFSEHDLLVLPSLTEISPNVALEARAYGLPVLLTEETGLLKPCTDGMLLREMKTAEQIQSALLEVLTRYDTLALQAAQPPPERGWEKVAEEFLSLLE